MHFHFSAFASVSTSLLSYYTISMFVTHAVFVFTQCQGKQKSDVSLSFLGPYNFAALS